MKKLLVIPLLAFALFSCQKEEAPKKEISRQEKKAVIISVADFIQVQENLKSPTGRSSNQQNVRVSDGPARISDVYYIAYASDGSKVNFLHQDTVANKSNFGIISDSLAPGLYTIVLLATEKALDMTEVISRNNISNHIVGPQLIGAMGVESLGDAFYKKIQVEILPSGNVVSLDVTLNRIAGLLEVDILDALSATHPNGGISVQATQTPVYFRLSDESVTPPDPWTVWVCPRMNQTIFIGYMVGSNYEFNVTIRYKDKITGADLEKTIEHVKCNINKKTIIKGYLYGVPGNAGGPAYQVKLNQEWDTDSNLINF